MAKTFVIILITLAVVGVFVNEAHSRGLFDVQIYCYSCPPSNQGKCSQLQIGVKGHDVQCNLGAIGCFTYCADRGNYLRGCTNTQSEYDVQQRDSHFHTCEGEYCNDMECAVPM